MSAFPVTGKQYLLALVLLGVVVAFLAPASLYAAPNIFGGPILTRVGCIAEPKVHFVVGPPRPRVLVWNALTSRTYANGGPRRVGQQTLGLYGLPDFCIVNITPLVIFPGRHVMMIGTSI